MLLIVTGVLRLHENVLAGVLRLLRVRVELHRLRNDGTHHRRELLLTGLLRELLRGASARRGRLWMVLRAR